MTALIPPANPGWPDVTRFEIPERLLGGDGGTLNRAPLQLLERTEFLKKQIDNAVSGALTFEYANRLKVQRTISMTGDGTWAVTFDGSGNVTAVMTLTGSGVAAGTYQAVTVDSKGRVTGGRALLAADIPGIDWGKITSGTPTTLAGYSIAIATQAEAEAGLENTKPTTVLRIFNALRSAAANATEALRGVLRVATQAEVDAGTDDATAVTPKKLRWGFAISKGEIGYIALPTWLGGLIFQWGYATTVADGSAAVTFPLAFPAACFVNLAMHTGSGAAVAIEVGSTRTRTGTTLKVFNHQNVTLAGWTALWMAVGS